MGFYANTESLLTNRVDKTMMINFYNVASNFNTYDVDGARILMEAGATGRLVMWRRALGDGDLVLQNAPYSGATSLNQLILKRTGAVQATEYGEGTFTGTPTSKLAVDSDGNFIEVPATESIIIACSDETTDLETGTGKVTFRMPYAVTLIGVKASVNTAPVGSTIIVDINENGSSILSTKLSIDASEKTSITAATPPVISDSALADDAEITIDIDQIGSSTAGAGLKVTLIYYRN
jgi:hypothetical protein